MSLGPIEFDNTRAIFTNDVTITDDLSAGDDLKVEGDTVMTGTLSAGGIINAANDIRIRSKNNNGLAVGGRLRIDEHDGDHGIIMYGGNKSANLDPNIYLLSSEQNVLKIVPGNGGILTNNLSANDLFYRDASTISAAGTNVSQLVVNNDTGEVQKTQASGVLPGTITPYYGHLAKSNGTRVDHATVAGTPGAVYYAWDDNTGAYDTGWGLCNGATYGSYVSPNLLGRTIVGVGQADIDSSISGGAMTTRAMSGTGGVDTLSLSPSALPDHSHQYVDQQNKLIRADSAEALRYGTYSANVHIKYAEENNNAQSKTGARLNFGEKENSVRTTGASESNSALNTRGGIYQYNGVEFDQVRDADDQGAPFEMSSAYYTLYYLIKLPD